jgi:polar amino acid transport system permease protein
MLSLVPASFDVNAFWQDLTNVPNWLGPALLVIAVTLIAQTAGVVLGFPLAVGRTSKNVLLRSPVNLYLYLFRGTPLLLQILFWYDGVAELSGNSESLYFITRNAVVAGTIALTTNEAAYMAEIIRSGLQAVDPGQMDAAKALGMTRWRAFTRIIVPQALRIIVPPTFNEYINMSKSVALLSTIGVVELIGKAENYFSADFKVLEALSVAAIWYLLITTVLTQFQKRIEDRFGERRDLEAAVNPGFLRRAFRGAAVR